jgi:hypothetical protein
MSQVNIELGRSSTTVISLNEGVVRTLAGVASGTISMNNLRGKSNVSFSPDGGASAGTAVLLSDSSGDVFTPSSVTITCSQSAVWNWTRSGSTAATASVVNGGSATSITLSLSNPTSTPRLSAFTLNSVSGGVTKYWNINLTNNGSA